MDSEIQPPTPEPVPALQPLDQQNWPDSPPPPPDPDLYRGLRWIFIGDCGLRAGWSVMIFFILARGIGYGVTIANRHLHFIGKSSEFTARSAFAGELVTFLIFLAAAAIVALIERRSVLDFNLKGPHRPRHFFSGLVAGFAALSALVFAMDWGGWLHFGPLALSGTQIFLYAALWGGAFLLVGFTEEGVFRCYLQFTLTRGINFWWALACIGAMCLTLLLRVRGNAVWGVYVIALAGLVPCFLLQREKSESAGFWQAAWLTSTAFGFVHTGNNGENWIGIFAAAAIGFVFCVSVKVTGSAWWAIGCHTAWDWAETYFYGTADSGFVAKGHYLSTSTSGNPLWSGGNDGPEGSLLVIGIVLLLLVALIVLYGRRKPAPFVVAATGQLAL